MKAYQDIPGFETLQSISRARTFNKWIYDTIFPYLKGPILELGSGIGNISNYILKDFSDVSLSDYNPEYCSILKAKFRHNKNLNSVLSINLQDQNFKKNNSHLKESFNTIILLNVIEHLRDDRLCVDYCSFLLKRGGNLIILAPAYKLLFSKFDSDIGHYRRYTVRSLSRLINNNDFNFLHTQYFNFLGMVGWLLFNKILAKRRLSESSMSTFDKLVPIAKILDYLVLKKIGVSTIVICKRK